VIQQLTLELPDDLAMRIQAAAGTNRSRVEEIAVDWMRRGAETDVGSLNDDAVLALSEIQMAESDQEELSDLLAKQRERELDGAGRNRLANLMDQYRRGSVVKAQALAEAAKRGLKIPRVEDGEA